MELVRSDMARLAYKGLRRVRGEHRIPLAYGFDVSNYRTYGEVAYGHA